METNKDKDEDEQQEVQLIHDASIAAEKGYVHIYTGDGKGKTTAAFGLAVRALMAGKKVFIGQFVKIMKYHETKLEDRIQGLTIKQFGNGCFIYKNEPTQEDKSMAVEGLAELERLMSRRRAAQSLQSRSGVDVDDRRCCLYYDMVILDEVTIALRYKLLEVEDVVRVIRERTPTVEVVVTGKGAPEELIQLGDVVTEMKAIKHYYKDQGVLARDGIER